MIVVAKALVDELSTNPSQKEKVQQKLFSRKSTGLDIPVAPPEIDRPMLELPAHLKPSPNSMVSLATLTSLLGDDVYGQMDEEYKERKFSLIGTECVTPITEEEPNPLEQLFTIKSVLASK